MTYELFIADRAFSSWSLRGWLMFEKFAIPVRTVMADLYGGGLEQDLGPLFPARLVPVLRTPEGHVIGETLAIAETLAERHPEAGLWPADRGARALARWMSAEMHAGFTALRSACPMQLLYRYEGFQPSTEVLADLERIGALIAHARKLYGAEGPWLFGRYSLADCFYAPVAARIAGYGLPVAPEVAEYVALTLADPAFRRWRALGLTKTYDPVPYAMALPTAPWPGPDPIAAHPLPHGPADNDACPYSGETPMHFMQLGDKVIGFCNPTCRDKSVLDPEAWPALSPWLPA
ncbi:glutathione S-transferase [Pseudooceanicola sp. CBS1P-1]|uniref:Glutathione S-transferase n=1 Tax=Pseudooceanicola albus TaxID=2692189 RepID=A0A6L7G310_9RHOB|nr:MULTISPECIES: glutathione S-transferase [Pseudooceanicola]MBT9384913.1 glutathione S-transferase [Pseudooceanicola endophyticus]MXN18092.1 glutathione S-transferase [Pseudooceanicola albus]